MQENADKKIEFQRVDLGGTCVNFPFTPYPLQMDYMKAVLQCLENSSNGLLESPTGTGKTLSLLCSTLAWLEKVRAAEQLNRLASKPEADGGEGEWKLPLRHKVIYSSRTHSQLSQAVGELARTSYRYMKVAILGSRDQLCVNPAVADASSSREKLHMCQARVKTKTCIFHSNVEKAKNERDELRDNRIMDIEDLHKLGKKHSFCPYYMSRELYQTADIIFMPYNYLLEDSIRKSLNIDFTGSVIIFDEGHNVQKLCEEASSFSISSQDLALAVKDVDDVLESLRNPEPSFDDGDATPKDLRENDLLVIKDNLLEIEGVFGNLLEGKESVTKAGTFASSIFASFINTAVVQVLDILVEHVNGKNTAAFSAKGRGVTKLLDFIKGSFNENVKPIDLETLYKTHVVKETKSDGGKGSFLKNKSENTVLNLWCFSPGFSMRRLAKLGPRSIILTSGTLSPLAATAEEIGIPFTVQLENQHVVGASQVWCGVLGAGADKTPLNSSFKSRSDPKYLNSLGQTVINLIKLVPKGVLIFFPSYGLLNSTREYWQNNGIWSRIDQLKKIMVEPQRKEALSLVMKDYYEEVKVNRGACFLAVCRGKVAEGLDFADDNGRAVLITGLPYPPFKDARAVGRVIRHSRDHGAVIFLDQRFGDHVARTSLSKWLQPFFQKFPLPGPAIQSLALFFKPDSTIGLNRQSAVAAHSALIAANKPSKRPLEEVKLQRKPETETKMLPLKPELYKQESLDSSNLASSIFSTSSGGINFTSISDRSSASSSTSSSSIAPEKKIEQKRKRIKLTNSTFFPTSDDHVQENTENRQSNEETNLPLQASMKYVRLLKRLLNQDEMKQFKVAVQNYKSRNKFDVLAPMLKDVIVKHVNSEPELLTRFRTFIKSEHLSEFEAFCSSCD